MSSVIKITQSGTQRIATLDWEDASTFSNIQSSYTAKSSAPASHLKDLPQPGIAEGGTVDNAGIGELRDVCSRFADTLAEASDQFSKACGHLSVAVEGAFVEMESVDTGTTEQFNHLTGAVPE